jgi:hypothetical protein
MAQSAASSDKTAWYLCQCIRAAMREGNADRLRGIVEIDETYLIETTNSCFAIRF